MSQGSDSSSDSKLTDGILTRDKYWQGCLIMQRKVLTYIAPRKS